MYLLPQDHTKLGVEFAAGQAWVRCGLMFGAWLADQPDGNLIHLFSFVQLLVSSRALCLVLRFVPVHRCASMFPLTFMLFVLSCSDHWTPIDADRQPLAPAIRSFGRRSCIHSSHCRQSVSAMGYLLPHDVLQFLMWLIHCSYRNYDSRCCCAGMWCRYTLDGPR